MKRTLKQQWSFERNFSFKGSLVGIKSRLYQISRGYSTLAEEEFLLHEAVSKLNEALTSWDKKESKIESWEQFNKLS